MEAVTYQAIYDLPRSIVVLETMAKLLRTFLDNYPKAKNQSDYMEKFKQAWNQHGGERALPLLNAVKNWVEGGNDPHQTNLLETLKEGPHWIDDFYLYYGTLRNVIEHYLKKDLTTLDDARFGFMLAGMKPEVIHHDTSPKEVVESISTLTPGLYFIALTAYNFMGKQAGKHATGLVVQENGTCVFLEPNFAVGTFEQKQMPQVLERTFKNYNGKIFDKDKISSGFDLYKITKAL